jgi:hypothetical protein
MDSKMQPPIILDEPSFRAVAALVTAFGAMNCDVIAVT